MDEENQALNDTGEENIPEESPTDEPTAEEDVQAESTEEAQAEETVDEPRKGAQSRIRQLNSEKKAAEEEARSLKQQLEELTRPTGFNPQQGDNQTQDSYYNDDGTIDPTKYEASIVKKVEAQNELRFRQQEAVNRINQEADAVLKKYPQLDPDMKEDFDQDLSDSITEAVDAHVRANPYSASVSKFVDKLMKPYTRSVDKQVGQATENIAKQVSKAAHRPTSVKQPEKSPSEMSLEELERKLGIVQS